MSFWTDQRVLVTGGTGFLGGHLVERLNAMRCAEVAAPPSTDYDLRDHAAIVRLYRDTRPTLVIHLAAIVGGIGANRERPGEFFYDNLMMGAQLLHEAWRASIPKFVGIGTVCAYPKFAPVPFKEEDLMHAYRGFVLVALMITASGASADGLLDRENYKCEGTAAGRPSVPAFSMAKNEAIRGLCVQSRRRVGAP